MFASKVVGQLDDGSIGAVLVVGGNEASCGVSGFGDRCALGRERCEAKPGSSKQAIEGVDVHIASFRFEAGNVPGGFSPIGYGQGGNPRLTGGENRAGVSPAYSPQVTIQVQAMDSRSFMDHSDDIARAVRDAMLNMHPMNDVVNDL